MSASTPVPSDHPLMIAWEAHKATEDYANSRRWALHERHVDGSLWALFMAGWLARGIDSGEAGETPKVARPVGQEPGAREGTRPEESAQPSLHIEPETPDRTTLPPLTDMMYHAVRGLEFEFGRGEHSVLGYMDDDMLDDIWNAINTALRVTTHRSATTPTEGPAQTHKEKADGPDR